MTARPNVDEIEARARVAIEARNDAAFARRLLDLCAYVRELEAALDTEEKLRHTDNDEWRRIYDERDQAVAERDAARADLHVQLHDRMPEWLAERDSLRAKLAEVEALREVAEWARSRDCVAFHLTHVGVAPYQSHCEICRALAKLDALKGGSR